MFLVGADLKLRWPLASSGGGAYLLMYKKEGRATRMFDKEDARSQNCIRGRDREQETSTLIDLRWCSRAGVKGGVKRYESSPSLNGVRKVTSEAARAADAPF